jgi:hypothetical protein
MNLLRAFARRPLADTALVAHALVVHAAVAALLAALGLKRATAALHRFSRARASRGGARGACQCIEDRVVWAVRTATHLVPAGRTCLTEALTAQYLVRRRGGDAELRLGVAVDAVKPFAAHAWLEAAGRIIIGGETASGYEPFAIPRI